MRKILVVLIFAVFILAGCANNQGNQASADMSGEQHPAEYQKITSAEAISMMADGEPFILLDVRTEAEFKESRIDGAVLIPDTEIKDRASDELPDKNARILVYCRSGRRSALAVQELINMGYTNVYDFGGIIDWPDETVSG